MFKFQKLDHDEFSLPCINSETGGYSCLSFDASIPFPVPFSSSYPPPSIEAWPKPTPSPRTENVSRQLRRVGFASQDSHRLVTRTYTRTFMVVCAHGSKELVSRDDWTIRHWRNKPEADLWGGENRRVLIIEETNPFVLAKGQQNSAVRCEIWSARTKSIASTLALVYVSPRLLFDEGIWWPVRKIVVGEIELCILIVWQFIVCRSLIRSSVPCLMEIRAGVIEDFLFLFPRKKNLLYLIVTECSICCVALREWPTCSRRKFISLINYFYFILLFES